MEVGCDGGTIVGKILVGSVRSHESLRSHWLQVYYVSICPTGLLGLIDCIDGSFWYFGCLSIMGLCSKNSKPLFSSFNFSDELRKNAYKSKS